MAEKTLSVIVPVYRAETYLDECVKSIVDQQYTDLEIILVDDGSPDQCPQICDRWAEEDSRIRVIHKSNGGQSDARNVGMEAAAGEYITFVDSDDYIDKKMFAAMLEAMNDTDADIAVCGGIVFDGAAKLYKHTSEHEKVYSPKEAFAELLTGGDIHEAPWGKVYKRSLFDGVCFPVGENNEDLALIPQILLRARSVVHAGEAFYYYRVNPNGISKGIYNEKKRIVIKHICDLEKLTDENYPELKREFGLFLAWYSFPMLVCMCKTPLAVKAYPEDYSFYRKAMRQHLTEFAAAKQVSFKNKAEAVLLCLGLYRAALKIKNIVSGLMQGNEG